MYDEFEIGKEENEQLKSGAGSGHLLHPVSAVAPRQGRGD